MSLRATCVLSGAEFPHPHKAHTANGSTSADQSSLLLTLKQYLFNQLLRKPFTAGSSLNYIRLASASHSRMSMQATRRPPHGLERSHSNGDVTTPLDCDFVGCCEQPRVLKRHGRNA
eukprot:356968-Chlamydomonas_euryale.AAC.19